MTVGDLVLLHPAGISVFKVLSVEDEHAVVESVLDSPGTFPFEVRVKYLVPAPS
ncbi:hypothetical protein ACFTWF_34845 [Rhodococcus sp. NPDC056960]|uniref:hypothetical protein n=1 Tax=Rhodococcus sp. NPDC056960 TaxID=3345982 RepID=UPI00363858BD